MANDQLCTSSGALLLHFRLFILTLTLCLTSYLKKIARISFKFYRQVIVYAQLIMWRFAAFILCVHSFNCIVCILFLFKCQGSHVATENTCSVDVLCVRHCGILMEEQSSVTSCYRWGVVGMERIYCKVVNNESCQRNYLWCFLPHTKDMQ